MLEDHDLLAERSLAALGSAPAVCVEILDAWRLIRGTEQLCDLLLWDERLSPELLRARREAHERRLEDLRRRQHLSRLRQFPKFQSRVEAAKRRAEKNIAFENRVWALTLLEVLPVALRQRLALSVLVNAGRQWELEASREERLHHVESALTQLALPLLERSASEWRRNRKTHSSIDAEVWLRQPQEEPACTLWSDSRGAHGALSLPLAWFTDVWARGIALVDGCFVLEVARPPRRRDSLDVLALRWERRHRELSRATPAPALVVRRGAEWRFAWR